MLYLRDLEEQRGRGFNVIIQKKGKSKKKEELLWGAIKKLPRELITELYVESPTYFSLLWYKNISALP